MSWDIYGNPLRRGYCEVHPNVHQEYPCSICMAQKQQQSQPHKTQLEAVKDDVNVKLLEALEGSVGLMRRLSMFHPQFIDEKVEDFIKSNDIEELIAAVKGGAV